MAFSLWLSLVLLLLFGGVLLIPIVAMGAFFSVKLGTFAFFSGKALFEEKGKYRHGKSARQTKQKEEPGEGEGRDAYFRL